MQGSPHDDVSKHIVVTVGNIVVDGAAALLERLHALDVVFTAADGRLRWTAPEGIVNESTRAAIVAHKIEILELLEGRTAPFPLPAVRVGRLVHAFPPVDAGAWRLADELRLRAHLRHLATAADLATVFHERGRALHHDRL